MKKSKKNICVTRTNVEDVKLFLGERLTNIKIERHPNGKMEILFKNIGEDIEKSVTVGDWIVIKDDKFHACELNPFTNEFQQKR